MPEIPAGAKTPADRKSKKSDVIAFEFEGVTYKLNKADFDDLEFVELLQDDKQLIAFRKLLGNEQWSKFKDSVRTDDGRVPADQAERFFELMQEQIEEANLS